MNYLLECDLCRFHEELSMLNITDHEKWDVKSDKKSANPSVNVIEIHIRREDVNLTVKKEGKRSKVKRENLQPHSYPPHVIKPKARNSATPSQHILHYSYRSYIRSSNRTVAKAIRSPYQLHRDDNPLLHTVNLQRQRYLCCT